MPYFKAKCKKCTLTFCYLDVHNPKRHIEVYHNSIFNLENSFQRQRWPWALSYFKYSYEYTPDDDKLYSQCHHCNTFGPSTFDSDNNHFSEHHEGEPNDSSAVIHWPLKYFKDDGDGMKCTICYRKLSVQFLPSVCDHLRNIHPESVE